MQSVEDIELILFLELHQSDNKENIYDWLVSEAAFKQNYVSDQESDPHSARS